MKKIIIVLLVAVLIGCEKEVVEPEKTITSQSLTFMCQNTSVDTTPSPLGLTIEYLDGRDTVSIYCKYVGQGIEIKNIEGGSHIYIKLIPDSQEYWTKITGVYVQNYTSEFLDYRATKNIYSEKDQGTLILDEVFEVPNSFDSIEHVDN